MEFKEGVALHKQISDWLKQRMERGVLKENEKLPSEHDLTEQFQVSRVTVRRALQTLENEQLIYRCQGLGSFVTDQRVHRSFSILSDFTEELEGSGLEASSRLLSFGPQATGIRKDILSILEIDEANKAVSMERIRLGNGDPVAYDQTWISLFYGQLIEGYDLEQRTIFDILETEYAIPIEKGCYRIEPAIAHEPLASHLQVTSGTPLLLVKRIAYTVSDKPVYYQERYYRNDKIVFEIKTERGQNRVDTNEAIPKARISAGISRLNRAE